MRLEQLHLQKEPDRKAINDAVIRLMQGEQLLAVAHSLGLSRVALGKVLKKHGFSLAWLREWVEMPEVFYPSDE